MRKIVIPNCFDPILEKVNRIISDESRDIHVLFVSFIMKSKGIFVALEVFERIAKEYENVFFHIAGQPLGDYLMPESEVKELFGKHFRRLDSEYPGRFVYHGVVKDDEKIDLFTKCDIFLFPTFFKTESFGLVNIEAMRTGNAVITTNHNFLPDIVTKNEGILVEPNNIEDTYMGMKYLIENPNKMKDLQRHNMDHAKNTYSPEAFKKLIKNLFMEFMLLDLHK
ncbi:glycosyltransferase family 4 protein [Mangrovibacterium sp.]|uniref:glycosyltransferase family 4 protein n=1 Tax=Mangrovibacterium sp. TaxID=1961364 RepID=UPI003569E0E3